MREIKFRAWDKRQEQMSEPFTLIALTQYEHIFETKFPHLARFKDLLWLEYTGLKDKSGKEYYAEDIFLKQTTRHIVRWNKEYAGWWLYWLDGGASMPFRETLAESGENIGNIYENPELLEEK